MSKNGVENKADAALACMRLDKFLKVSRIIKRRSVANDACDTGHVMLNGKEAKAGANVRVGDILSLRYGERLTQYEVLSISEHAQKADAALLYRVIP
jgi:ribosomal 50S subunit-recycling heat shock protein